MPHSRSSLGARGEDLAATRLATLGWTIVERNYRCALGEIDIIAREGDTLVFVEVKTRKSNKFGSPSAAVTTRKQQQISRVAQHYLAKGKRFSISARFDVVAVTLTDGNEAEIELISNAFDLAC